MTESDYSHNKINDPKFSERYAYQANNLDLNKKKIISSIQFITLDKKCFHFLNFLQKHVSIH